MAESDAGFGEWLGVRRRELGLTAKKLARLVGCSPVTVQKIEGGYRRPSPPLAEALARHLEIDPDDLRRFLRAARTPPPLGRRDPPRAQRGSASLPAATTPLFGRADERLALGRLLLDGERRLVTVVGPPGVGKTRLALAVASEVAAAFEESCFVPLAAVADATGVWPDLVARLGVSVGGAAVLERLVAHLAGRGVLLVLDNLEHLSGALIDLAVLLERTPGLRVLATSREPLRLSGEQVFPLAPLPLPPSGASEPQQVLRSPAVTLFLERARAVAPGASLDASSAAAVASIVKRLDGLPLAIELAAGRAAHLSFAELAAELAKGLFASLPEGARDLPNRQRTLEAAIAWSYERLDTVLQKAFRHLAVFAGGFTLEAAMMGVGVGRRELEVLLAASLVGREADGRYFLLETLRAFALERLSESGEMEAAREAHAGYYLAARERRAFDDLDWVAAEAANLRLALAWSVEKREAGIALRLVVGLRWLWETQGLQREAIGWYDAALALPDAVDAELRLRALLGSFTAAWQMGLFERALAVIEIGLDTARRENLPTWEAELLVGQGRVLVERGQPEAALAPLGTALELAEGHDSADTVVSTLYQLADAKVALGRPDEARVLLGRGLSLCRAEPASFWEPPMLILLGELALDEGALAEAREHLGLALAKASRGRHSRQLTLVLACIAGLLAALPPEERDVLAAARLWGAVEALREAAAQPFAAPHAARIGARIARAKTLLPEREWRLSWEAGRYLSLAEAVALAREALEGKG